MTHSDRARNTEKYSSLWTLIAGANDRVDIESNRPPFSRFSKNALISRKRVDVRGRSSWQW